MKPPIYSMLKKVSWSNKKRSWDISWWQHGGSILIDGRVVQHFKKWSRVCIRAGGKIK